MKPNDTCTVYILINTVNGKKYIGQTWYPLSIRMGKDGANYIHSVYLYNSIQKYGAENFRYEVLDTCECQDTADYFEQYWIEFYNTRDPDIGYNLKEGGSVGRHSKETKLKISNTLKAQAEQWTPEERSKRAAPIAGYWAGKERGPHTEEWKENNSKMMIERHSVSGHPMEGKHHTEEAKALISAANKGRKRDPESVAKGAQKRKMDPAREQGILQAYCDGMIIDDIENKFQTTRSSIYRILDRNNVSKTGNHKGWVGKQHSEETKRKMSEAKKKYWEEKRQEDLIVP